MCILNAFPECLLDDCSMFARSCEWGIMLKHDRYIVVMGQIYRGNGTDTSFHRTYF